MSPVLHYLWLTRTNLFFINLFACRGHWRRKAITGQLPFVIVDLKRSELIVVDVVLLIPGRVGAAYRGGATGECVKLAHTMLL